MRRTTRACNRRLALLAWVIPALCALGLGGAVRAANVVTWTSVAGLPPVSGVIPGNLQATGPNLADPDLSFDGIVAPGTSVTDHAGGGTRPWTSIQAGDGGMPPYSVSYARVTSHDGSWAGQYTLTGQQFAWEQLNMNSFAPLLASLNAIPNGETRRYVFQMDYNYQRTLSNESFRAQMYLQDTTGAGWYSPYATRSSVTSGWAVDSGAFLLTVTRDTAATFNSTWGMVQMNNGSNATLALDNIRVFALVPEPASLALVAVGALALVPRRRQGPVG